MRNLTPIAIVLMMLSVILWPISWILVMILAIIALVFFIIQVIRRQKTEPIIFLGIIMTVIILVIDIMIRR